MSGKKHTQKSSEEKQKALAEQASKKIIVNNKSVKKWMEERKPIIEEMQKITKDITELENKRTKLFHKANKVQGKIVKWCKSNIKLDEYHEFGEIKIEDDHLVVDDIDLIKLWKLTYKKK